MRHGNARREGWWYHAEHELRLAQIDAAIALGMTARQCAINCGAGIYESGSNYVTAFANIHGRKFRDAQDERRLLRERLAEEVRKRQALRPRALTAAQMRSRYIAGEPVDFWGAK